MVNKENAAKGLNFSNDPNVGLVKELVKAVQKQADKDKVDNAIKSKPAKVVGTDDETQKVFVYFLDDAEQTIFTFFNKTGEIISEGDNVKIFYTSNPAKGWIGERNGEPRYSDTYSLEPITAITINSNVDYSVQTNSGMERYVGIFEV